MLTKLRWFSRAEDRLDAWVTRQHQERVLDGRTAPDGPCPNEASWKALPDNPNRSHCRTREWIMQRIVLSA